MYNTTQASQCAATWNAFNTGDQLSSSDALSLMNGPEPVDEQVKRKRDLLLLVAAIIAGALAAAAGQ